MTLIRSNISKQYDTFSGKTLERYFQQKYMETGDYTNIGNWWDGKRNNEIDMIALNEFNHSGVIAEIKRNPKRINLNELKEKIERLPKQSFGKFTFDVIGLSLENM